MPSNLPATLADTTPWTRVVDTFLEAAIDSPNTRRAYRRHLYDALGWMGCATLAELHGASLTAYRFHLTSSALSPASQSQALAALRAFLRWAQSMGAHFLNGDVLRTALRTPKTSVARPYAVLSDREITAVINATTTPRDRALLTVLLGSGLRVSEVVGLDVADVIEDADGETMLYVRMGKGRKDRTVPIRLEAALVIRAYLASTGRRLGDDGPLFRAHDRAASKLPRGRLTARAVGQLVARVTQQAGVDAKRISPHSLRHTYAIRMVRSGAPLVAVQKILGHASITTTARYADHLEMAELRAAIPALPA